ncbi:MAG: hypothetical protein RJQ07_01550 [Pseudomonadales bacterium]
MAKHDDEIVEDALAVSVGEPAGESVELRDLQAEFAAMKERTRTNLLVAWRVAVRRNRYRVMLRRLLWVIAVV